MLINIKNLNKEYIKNSSFFSKEQNFSVLKDITFSLEERKVLAIIGESGSGKTTLAKIICRLTDFDSGTVEIAGKNINDYTRKEFSNTVQMIFQNSYSSFNPKLTVGYSLSETLNEYEGCESKEEQIKNKLSLVGLEQNILDKYPYQFSGGQRQRIAIARALLKEPKILIADEPFASLDVVNQSLIMDIFMKIKKERKTDVILITHDISSAMELSDKILILQNGKIVKYGDVENIKYDKTNNYVNELISAVYLME